MKSLGPPEPVRLLAGASTPFERRLLASAAQDAMPAAALQHLAQALHVPSSAVPALSAELQRTAWLGKVAALAGLGALGVIAAVVASSGHPAPAGAAAAPVAAVVAPTPEVVSPEVVSPAAVSLAEAPPAEAPRNDVAQTEPAQPRVATPGPRASARTVTAAARRSEAQGLRAELQALEAVQSALRAQHPDLAADALAAYSRRFPAGELEREAELLGVDVALARGDRELARARARELLSKPDGARYRERLDALRIESSGSAHGSPEVIR
jgi:hypothetical protein